MKTNRQKAFTLIEMLVVISIIAILAAFAVPALTSALTKGQMTGTMNNGRQLYLAAQQMALDGAANSDATLTWPGDANPAITKNSEFLNLLTVNNYLKGGDVQKLMNAPGASYTVTSTVAADGTTNVTACAGIPAFKIFKVKDADSSNTIFLETNNYVYNSKLDQTLAPYADKGFIVQRKGGDASILRKNNVTAAQASSPSVFQTVTGKQTTDADNAPTPEQNGLLLTNG
ncbi:MAG: type II secretion system protein [Chthoniobacterales bacterium]